MQPYTFDAPDTDTILRSSDGNELRVHQLILSLESPVFQGMFNLPQATKTPPEIPTIDVSESSDILRPFLCDLFFNISILDRRPKISDLQMWDALYTIADKYAAERVMDLLKDILLHRFLDPEPLRVYALASHWGFEEAAKIASAKTLTMDIFQDLSREETKLMGGPACQQLHTLHFKRREAAREVVAKYKPSSSCGCYPPD